MPWCSRCNHYAATVEFRRVPNRNDEHIYTYVCKNRVACAGRVRETRGPVAPRKDAA